MCRVVAQRLRDEADGLRDEWAREEREFNIIDASQFFIGVMLDQQQPFARAWEGGRHFVDTYFPEDTIWRDIEATSLKDLEEKLAGGFEGKSYAGRNVNKFPGWLMRNAKIMNSKYEGDPRNIWNVEHHECSLIFDRFKEFSGIGYALARMAQFLLVKRFGVAGGWDSRKFWFISQFRERRL